MSANTLQSTQLNHTATQAQQVAIDPRLSLIMRMDDMARDLGGCETLYRDVYAYKRLIQRCQLSRSLDTLLSL